MCFLENVTGKARIFNMLDYTGDPMKSELKWSGLEMYH